MRASMCSMSDYEDTPDLPDNPVWLTRREAAQLLRVALPTIDLWAREGRIKRWQLKVPGSHQYRPRFSYRELNALIQDWEPGEFGRGGISDLTPRPKKRG